MLETVRRLLVLVSMIVFTDTMLFSAIIPLLPTFADDYGLSKLMSASVGSAQTQSIGTVHYMAPEISTGNYGKQIDVSFIDFIRPERKFDGLESLKQQIAADGEVARRILAATSVEPPGL